MSTKLQNENPRGKHYVEVNDKIYSQLGKRHFAFKFESENFSEQLFVFTEPTIGQMEVITTAGGKASEGLPALRKVFNEMIILPETAIFDDMYASMFNNELAKFGNIFAFALGEKQKK